MKNKITRKDKKKLRAIILCHTGNIKAKKSKYSKNDWLALKWEYKVWLSFFTMRDRKSANGVRKTWNNWNSNQN